jgi:Uncharacterized protein conserved in bacteria (DUF2252)
VKRSERADIADIGASTGAYESWLRERCSVVASDLRLKHRHLMESPFVFLRGTFYRWMQLWPSVCAELTRAPRVLAIGDLHIENFGTWRDVEGRLVWGVNDMDEAYELPYTLDLVRLATSALLASYAQHLALSPRATCDAILEGYTNALDRGGRPLVLAERYRWLRKIAVHRLRDPSVFWARLEANPAARGRVPHAALRSLMPDHRSRYRTLRRIAGVGSLGRPRFVAIAESGGSLIAREAKAAVPSACAWAVGDKTSSILCERIISRAVRVGDPFFGVSSGWIVRRLAPDCTRIELTDLPRDRDEVRLLRAMGWETANVHLGTISARVRADLRHRPRRWLQHAAGSMIKAVVRDWRSWRSSHQHRRD